MAKRFPLIAGMLVAVLVCVLATALPESWRQIVQVRAEDALMRLSTRLVPQAFPPAPKAPEVVIIDIDAATVRQVGAWPWPRETLARLVERLAATKPSALALDMLLAGADPRSPVEELVRRGIVLEEPALSALMRALPNGDARLAAALEAAPSVLGLVMDPQTRGSSIVPAHVLSRGGARLTPQWRGAGILGPPVALAGVVSGLGVIALPGDADGVIRTVPLFVAVGGVAYPGLALEALRVGQDSSAYLIESAPPGAPTVLRVGDFVLPMPDSALVRLIPDATSPRVISAGDVLSDMPVSLPAGSIILVGGSAPELGGLRSAQDNALEPAVVLQARALKQIMQGLLPRPSPWADALDVALLILIPGLAISAALLLSPLAGVIALVAGLLTLMAVTMGLFAFKQWLLVPLLPALAGLGGFSAASLMAFVETRRREAHLRQRFSQHLAPQIVEMIVANPRLVKLGGEKREITAFFTDVEDFTATTERADPAVLVEVLDDYFEGLAGILVRHGGMIDKFVGDAMHAFFNAPLDLADHPAKALACAQDIARWAEDFRARPGPLALGFGRTRIGLETGFAIVGDVGLRAKLDYTAHGTVVNSAARLEAANKHFGSSLCLGPKIAARLPQAALRPLGTLALRGLCGETQVFDLWPENTSADWQARYREALRLFNQRPEVAAEVFRALANEAPHDGVCRRFAALNIAAGT